MGRRYGFSISAANRFAASIRASNARKERETLIEMQCGTAKELAPQYSLYNVEFNDMTRVTKVTFKCTKQYRTIDRYVTQNYQRYPIYSGWKTKTSYVDKRLKLTNMNLESLYLNEDNMVKEFASEIILSLNNPDLIPSWLATKIIHNEHKEKIKEQEDNKKTLRQNYNNNLAKNNQIIASFEKKIGVCNETKKQLEKRIAKKEKQIEKLEKNQRSVFLVIITFGLYLLAFTKKRYLRLRDKRKSHCSELEEIIKNIAEYNQKILQIQQTQKQDTQILKENFAQINAQIVELNKLLELQLKEVQTLPCTYKEDSSFISLKQFIGLEYEKIIGCYIIQNVIKDKYYVGQSKDVMRRLKQHFKGTVPNNVIFAEDYYSTAVEDRDNLFKVKIIQLQTKDELDSTEMQLIDQYDANNTGYNSTKGNI